MTGRSTPGWLALRAVAAAPVVAAIMAEGGWIAVPGTLFQALSHRPVLLGPIVLAAVALAGVALSRTIAARLGPAWPVAAVAATGLAAAAGWLTDADVRSAIAAGDAASAVARHPGGWLAGIALLRGFAYSGTDGSLGAARNLTRIALPGVAATLVLGGVMTGSERGAFFADALAPVTVFVASSVLAVSLASIVEVSRGSGLDWQGNRAWLGLLLALVAVIVAAAVPAAFVFQGPLHLVLEVLPAPLMVLGLLAGFRRAWRQTLAAMGVLGFTILVIAVISRFGTRYETAAPDTSALSGQAQNDPAWTALVAWVAVLAVLAALVALLAWSWRRTGPRAPEGNVVEERTIDARGAHRPARVRRSRSRRATPTTAAEAYVALVADLAGRPGVARRSSETPLQHAGRLRAAGDGEAGLDLLVADYELDRFGAIRLTAAEDRRGLARWRRLRASLGRR